MVALPSRSTEAGSPDDAPNAIESTVAQALLGSEDGQVVGSDRFSAYDWILARWRQVCWAHTIRTQSTIRSVSRSVPWPISLPMTRPRRLIRARA